MSDEFVEVILGKLVEGLRPGPFDSLEEAPLNAALAIMDSMWRRTGALGKEMWNRFTLAQKMTRTLRRRAKGKPRRACGGGVPASALCSVGVALKAFSGGH